MDRTVRDAVILAAGRGTRMGGLTREVPKPMLPVDGQPVLEHIVRALHGAGVERMTLVVGYLADQVKEHFGTGDAFGVEIRYAEQTVRDGTARALLLGRDGAGDRPFLLAWGDILTARRNYARLITEFVETGASGVLAVNWVDDPYRGAAVTTDESRRILSIVEKPPQGTSKTNWTNAGIGVFAATAFDYAERVEPSPRGEYEIPDAIRMMMDDGGRVVALPLEGFWTDVGTPADLEQAHALVRGDRADG